MIILDAALYKETLVEPSLWNIGEDAPSPIGPVVDEITDYYLRQMNFVGLI